jgi:hypothetical protein
MNDTSEPTERKKIPATTSRVAHGHQEPQLGGRRLGSPPLRIATLIIVAVMPVALLSAGCVSVTGGNLQCAPVAEALPSSRTASLIAVVPRTSAISASWGLRELALLLPFAARPGLELHVLYTQDGDDLGESGGDGGPPQVLEAQAPPFAVLWLHGAPKAPADPNALTAKLYCERLVAWQHRAGLALRKQAVRRTAVVTAWARSLVARLTALASKPIPDTTGREAGVEFDAGASIFSAALLAEAAPRPTILFLGGLTSVAPPSQDFRFHGRLLDLVRSASPARVIHTVRAWRHWVVQAGGTFLAMSANDTPTEISRALVS